MSSIILVLSKTYGPKEILVDDKYYEWLNRFSWHVVDSGEGFYAVTNYGSLEKRLSIRTHCLLFPNSEVVDHINGNGLDNREENLRPTTQANNTKNRFKKKGSSSKYKGVFEDRCGSWRASITNNGIHKYLGAFSTEEAAASSYNFYARELHGEYAKLNKLDEIENFEEYKRTTSSKYRYITYDKTRELWTLRIKHKHIGRFETEELAYKKYLEIMEK